jgi:hypothetical protein
VGEGRVALALLVTFIQRSAWKMRSRNFVCTEFSEGRSPSFTNPVP